jgi:putative glycosyltransferase
MTVSDGSGAPNEGGACWPHLTIVTSLYKSARYIKDFHARHVTCLAPLGIEFDFVFVNDDSPDDSEVVVRQLMEHQPAITLVSLSRNFGQQAAMLAGLTHATGDFICALDCDLEEEPENVVAMFELMQANPDIDVVYAVVDRRTAGWLRNTLSSAFYGVLNVLSRLDVPADQAWQRVMSRRYLQELLRFQESKALYVGLMQLTGFNQRPYRIRKQYKGASSYSLLRKLVLAVDSIVSFTSAPLLIISCLGFVVTFVSFLCIGALVILWMSGRSYQTGWPSVIASVWCVGGLILTSVGVVGVYLARVFDQVKNRPRYIVKRITRSGTQECPS